MPIYVLLTKLTPKGRETLHREPDRLDHVNQEIEGMGFRILSQYALLGAYDFITTVEAPSNDAIARLSVSLGGRGTVAITTLSAIPVEQLKAKLKDRVQLGRAAEHQHAQFFDPKPP